MIEILNLNEAMVALGERRAPGAIWRSADAIDLPFDDGFSGGFTGSGIGDGSFNIPPLAEAADTPPLFHNNAAATIEDAVVVSSKLAASANRKIYVAGGLFLAIEYAAVARGGRAQDLGFL